MAWIELHQSLPSSRKTLNLRSRLNLKTSQAVGHLCMLWLWALDNVKDGNLAGVSAKGLAEIADFNVKRADEFLDALIEVGFIDKSENSLKIHDWENYSGRYVDARDKAAARQRKHRQKKLDEKRDISLGHAHVTPLDKITEDDMTQEDITKQAYPSFADDDAPRDAGAQMREYLQGRGLLPETFLGASESVIAECRALADELFKAFATRRPTETDYAKVFQNATKQWRDAQGIDHCLVANEQVELLRYAFEQAAISANEGHWGYINGVLVRLHRRGIKNLGDAEMYDIEREEG